MQKAGPDKWTIQWQSTAEARAKQGQVDKYWQWIRVYEHYRERFADDRYERQEQIALRIMERSRTDPKLIKYIS